VAWESRERSSGSSWGRRVDELVVAIREEYGS